jgi:hypothetical protein
MTVRDGNVNSDQSVSWHAHREAEALSDASLISELAEYVQHESKQDCRGAAYFILGKLGEKFPALECAAILVAQAKKEKNKYVLATLLGALAHVSKSNDLDLTPSMLFSQTKGGWFAIPPFNRSSARAPHKLKT